MGQASGLSRSGGAGTVRMGRCVRVEIGGLTMPESRRREEGLSGSESEDFTGLGLVAGRPEIVGGGSSRPSLALRVSWRAKSEACHHSRNLSAKMDVGRRIFRLERRLGYTLCVIVLGWKIDVVCPGLAPVPAGVGLGCNAIAIAWLSAILNLRIRVPTSHKNGEWNFEPSNRYARLKASREK